ncbi:MAG: ATP-dependent Clp protease ATP-binding subunit [Planctomycetes bacterium]|nr:ATP-dependent Clp protease ATP-binding subunit [Planctomycetota bacterium]
MIRPQTSLVLKYCQGIDRFVRVRRFSLQDVDSLLSGASVNDRRSYVDLIVNACVVNLDSVLSARAESLGRSYEDLREEMYLLAVEVNPELEITRVSVPVAAEDAPGLTLIEKTAGERRGLDTDTALSLEKTLRCRIIGQDEAVHAVAQAILRSQAGIRDESRPIGTFLFVGPTGVGKTELAKVLADTVYGGSQHLLRVDCSEYSMGHEYAKLIGAPPGYVGHENGGYLTESMLKMKEGIVLFDEVEKAHEKVHNLLLQLMDEGFVTDGKGVRIDFTGCIVIMTSNLGVKEVRAILRKAGFRRTREEGDETVEERRRASLQAVRDYFNPEFVNRIDDVMIFNPIENDVAERIFDLVFQDLSGRLQKRGLVFEISNPLRRSLLEEGVNRRYGARPLKRVVRRRLEAPIAEAILRRRDVRGMKLKATLARDGNARLSFTRHGNQ